MLIAALWMSTLMTFSLMCGWGEANERRLRKKSKIKKWLYSITRDSDRCGHEYIWIQLLNEKRDQKHHLMIITHAIYDNKNDVLSFCTLEFRDKFTRECLKLPEISWKHISSPEIIRNPEYKAAQVRLRERSWLGLKWSLC